MDDSDMSAFKEIINQESGVTSLAISFNFKVRKMIDFKF